jgi:membrane-associated phospholipid phosphatase
MSASMWTIGKFTDNERISHTGRLATAAVLQTELLVGGIKLLASRERPDKVGGEGEFRAGGQSFPSGHTATSFAFATVVANEYRDKPWVSVGAYGMATAVGLSRIGGLRHFPSDVLIGATIGHLIGRYILRHHD